MKPGRRAFWSMAVPVILIVVMGRVFMTTGPETHKFFLVLLLLLYPLLFLIQGAVAAWLDTRLLAGLGASGAACLLFMAVWMNSSAFGYVPVYLLLGLIGFGTARMLRKWTKGR